MLVHEETGAVDRAWTIELPQLAQRRRLSTRMVLERLRIGPNGPAVRVEDADRVRNDVEDGLELRDAAGQTFTQLLPLGHVAAGEENPAPARFVDQRREGGFDQPASAAMLKGNTRYAGRRSLQGCVDLIREVGQRVRERVV